MWTLSGLPGVDPGATVYLLVAGAAGVLCAVLGLRSGDRTADALGAVWEVLWKLSLGIIGIVRSLTR